MKRVGRPRDRDFNDDEWSPILRFRCKAPHSELCPFNTCRNADRYWQSVTQRGRLSQDLLLADFTCSLKYELSDGDKAAALAKMKKKDARAQTQDYDAWNTAACYVVGCTDVGDKKFSSKNRNGSGIEIDYICDKHYRRLLKNKNILSFLWTKKELQEDDSRRCS